MLVLGWFAFVRGVRVPIVGMVDLGVHELGHMLFAWAPELVMVCMGNGTQSLLPLIVAVCFAVFRRDWPACGLCLAWCGTTLQDASVYIADAPYQRLVLLHWRERPTCGVRRPLAGASFLGRRRS